MLEYNPSCAATRTFPLPHTRRHGILPRVDVPNARLDEHPLTHTVTITILVQCVVLLPKARQGRQTEQPEHQSEACGEEEDSNHQSAVE